MAENKGKVKQAQGKKMTIQSTIKSDLIANFKEADDLEKLLGTKLSVVFPNKSKIKIDWEEIRKEKLPKRLRREKIRSMKESKKLEILKEGNIQGELQKYVIIGFNCVVKQLQEGQISSVLVNSKLPSNLLMFLLPLCQSKQVPVLGLDMLDVVTKSVLGFSSMVLGLHLETGQEENHFFAVCELVKSVWEKSRSEDSKNCDDAAVERMISDKNAPEEADQKVCRDKSPGFRENIKIKNFHLKRKSSSERVFIPVDETKTPVEKRDPAPQRKKKALNFPPYYNSKLL